MTTFHAVPPTPLAFPRGATLRFATTFYDFDGVETQPSGAIVHIQGVGLDTQVAMTPPAGAQTRWTASFDTRGVSPGMVYWSIHSLGAVIPFSVEDGALRLTANTANLQTF